MVAAGGPPGTRTSLPYGLILGPGRAIIGGRIFDSAADRTAVAMSSERSFQLTNREC
jgi:hypothetical protein